MTTTSTEEKWQRYIRWLIWTYFWLLLVEGALRKWVVPTLSNPLLVIRDPVVLLIYAFSIRARVFPKNAWVISLVITAMFCVLTSYISLWMYVPPVILTAICGYGVHANFFHLPLIFVMASVLRFEDVKRIGWWTLLILIPMTALMVVQFRSAPDAFVNLTAGGEGEMMMSALGKVRTAGPFSFVVGVAAYFSLATGFLVWAILRSGTYKTWLLAAAGAALIIGVAISGSRLVVGACVVVVASLALVVFVRPDVINRFGQVLLGVVVLGFVVSRTPIFREGVNVLSTRMNEVAEATDQGVTEGLISRVLAGFEDGMYIYTKAPLFGYGLGIGTNAGAKFLTGQAMFLLSEGEWSRIFLESGPILGLAYVMWRLLLVAKVGWSCVKCVRLGNLLPLLTFASAFMALINGQFGQPTTLGFAVFATGLTLAAMKGSDIVSPPPPETERVKVPSRVRGRSVYAERLHGSTDESKVNNGSVDR
jgi:hypothetical protein